MRDFDALQNHGGYFATHYFTEQLGDDLKKGLFKTWTLRETDEIKGPHQQTPRVRLAALRPARTFFRERAAKEADEGLTLHTYDDELWREQITAWHRSVLTALGFDTDADDPGMAGVDGTPATGRTVEVPVHHAGRDLTIQAAYHGNGILALDCSWADSFDGALDPQGPARLLHPLRVTGSEQYPDGASLARFLLHAQEVGDGAVPLRFVLLLLGGIVVLADRRSFGEERYLAANLDTVLSRGDTSKTGENATIAALLCKEMLQPRDNGRGPMLDDLHQASTQNTTGVTDELRDGLRESVELIAGEVLALLDRQRVDPQQIAEPRVFARQLTRESLRYLYRILFLLYAEARPELGILPAEDDDYVAGYSVARLRDLAAREERLVAERSRNGTHLFDSLDLLFRKVNKGHRPYGTEPDDDLPGDDEQTRADKAARRSKDLGLRFEQLNSDLFADDAIQLIGTSLENPNHDEDDPDSPATLDTRLRNATLHRVLRRLTLTSGKAKTGAPRARGGFISYRNLGISQLGAVYEGLMSYNGFIATEELYEVAKNGDPKDGSWVVPASKIDQYPDAVFVKYPADDPERRTGRKRYQKGEFVYRLSGRERQTSASYYTPDSLTKLTVELTLRERLGQPAGGQDEPGSESRAAKLLQYKICEPALGSGSFLNEAIDQVAAEYLRRRETELKTTIPTSEYLTELRKVKAYIALHNSYGVDLNDTAVELAEVSIWLATMHPGMRAPWFGLHLRRGNSLIGGRRAIYAAEDAAGKQWHVAKDTLAPTELPFLKDGVAQPLPEGAVHQFLLPAVGWAAVSGETDVKKMAEQQAKQLAKWRSGILKAPSVKAKKGTKSQLERLQALARRAEFLWSLVVERMKLSENEIARKIDIWGANPADPEFSFLKQPKDPVKKEKVYADLFGAVGTPYWRLKTLMDTWCALWFWPLDKTGLIDGTAAVYTAEPVSTVPDFVAEARRQAQAEATPVAYMQQDALFGEIQGVLVPVSESDEAFTTEVRATRPRKQSTPKPRPIRRRTIPLKDMADWLDFAEALLGVADVPADSLAATFPSLDELSAYEDLLPEFMGMDSETQLPIRFPWLDTVQDIAEERGFFHWELSFAYVFAVNGGFDLQAGNPPWVRPDWNEPLVLAEHEPWFALTEKASEAEKSKRRSDLLRDPDATNFWHRERLLMTGLSKFYSSPTVYPLGSGTRPDLYRCFMARTWANSSHHGTIGLVHPDTHLNGEREAHLRAAAYRRLRVHGDFVNAGNKFFPPPVGHASHFGLHVYGPKQEIRFDSLSWLYSVDALRYSPSHNGLGEAPGVKRDGEWNKEPHRTRVVRVDAETLNLWQRLSGETTIKVEHARLLAPVSTAEEPAIRALADFPIRFGDFDPQISSGFNETTGKTAGLIEYNLSAPESWGDVVLKGLQLGVATPFFKEPDAKSADRPIDLRHLPSDTISRTSYRATENADGFERAKDKWIDYVRLAGFRADPVEIVAARTAIAQTTHVAEECVTDEQVDDFLIAKSRRPYTDFYRLAWRRMIASDTERSLYVALLPPGPSHIDGACSAALESNYATSLACAFWGSIPIDYHLCTAALGHLDVAGARRMPAPSPKHPLASALLLRALRLNCLTTAYAELWSEVFDPSWLTESWALEWPKLQALNAEEADWKLETGFRTERSRRAALVEIDALVAVWLGIDADTLLTMYRARFPILQDFERVMWFDAKERKIAGNRATYGWGQTKEDWLQFEKHLKDPDNVPPPPGYTAPFYKAEREEEMRAAHAVFQRRLDEAVARGEWDPVKQEVPQP
ncbi:hypothetical protein KGQ20_07250 [Catenulispora sp. NF23]|uniref:DNA methyltransferase n=1 Tax=Catenulispora pinistramenti TaxID=2705254 RepID=UPI001BA4A0C7|nr:DNA methyltransferase [Catenulispora pinistramenti]MBS2532565.1 hypothetical protein [Catenulispora pinistramenti]